MHTLQVSRGQFMGMVCNGAVSASRLQLQYLRHLSSRKISHLPAASAPCLQAYDHPAAGRDCRLCLGIGLLGPYPDLALGHPFRA